MKPELAVLARHRLAQAHETLAEANQLFRSHAFRGAVNRLYYEDFATVDPADARDLASAVQTFVDTCQLLLDRLLRDA